MRCCGTYWFEGAVDRNAPHDRLYDHMELLPRSLTWDPECGHLPVILLAPHPIGYVVEFLVAADAASRSILVMYVQRWIAHLVREQMLEEIEHRPRPSKYSGNTRYNTLRENPFS